MKKLSLLCALLLAVALFTAGCTKGDTDAGNSAPGGIITPDAAPDDTESETSQPANSNFFSAQNTEDPKWAKIPMVMVDGKLYYDTGKESALTIRCGTSDGEITSTVDGTEIPTEDNQSNFGSGFRYQYGDGNTIEVFMDETWRVFEHRAGDGSQISFGDKRIDAAELSEETLEWLVWYNSLSEEARLKVSAVPAELLEKSGLAEAADTSAAN